MAEGGFNDLEMKNINEEKEEENERMNEETSFNNDDDHHNNSINIINTSNPKSKYSRVDYIPDMKKDAGSIKKSLTNDKKIFQKYVQHQP